MINPTVLAEKLKGLVGFRQPFNPDYAILEEDTKCSRSGYFINDNPFVKIESIKDSQDYKDISDCDFNKFLKNKIATSIVNVANAVFNQSDYIDRQLIYKNAANKIEAYALPPGFIGYWIQVSGEKNVAFMIKRCLLEFKGTGDIKLYLYNTADLTTPLHSKNITITKPFQEVTLDWFCDNAESKGYKGDYYLGYFTAGMSLYPFKREYREASMMSALTFLSHQRIEFPLFTKVDDIFDLNGMQSTIPYNGLNPDITVYEDFTDLIIQNEKLFARAIMIDCQINLLTESIASLRSNRNERISAQYVAQLMAQVEGETGEGNVKVKGLRPQWFGAIGAIKKELEKLKNDYQGGGQIMVESLC